MKRFIPQPADERDKTAGETVSIEYSDNLDPASLNLEDEENGLTDDLKALFIKYEKNIKRPQKRALKRHIKPKKTSKKRK
ncbi:MAG: hypothetical protein ACI39E_00260 [Acutalibacteraceae bacterium]